MATAILWRLFALIWLIFLYYPALNLLSSHPTPLRLVMTLVGAPLFVVIYLALVLPIPFGVIPARVDLAALALCVTLAADIALLALLSSLDWFWFFILVSIALGVRLPPRAAAIAILATGVLSVAIGVKPFGWVYAVRIALPVVVVGLGMIGVGQLIATIRALRAAREEIARLAVAEERLRFARDLHDLLGHSLAAITLKNEVARSLIPTEPERAARELGDALGVAREALREVRQVVAGYRQPTLPLELRSARTLLDAAGMTCSVEDADGMADGTTLEPQIEALLAWTVREGATNVVRHSGARHCAIAILRHGDTVTVELTNDGAGDILAAHTGRSGSGLRGLAERAAQVGGSVEAGPCAPSGFRLRVSAPFSASETGREETPSASQVEWKGSRP